MWRSEGYEMKVKQLCPLGLNVLKSYIIRLCYHSTVLTIRGSISAGMTSSTTLEKLSSDAVWSEQCHPES